MSIPFIKKNLFVDEIDGLRDYYQNKFHEPVLSVENYFQEAFGYKNFKTTKSCTQSLEIALMALNLPKGGEVILPSFGFVSLANAIALMQLKCVFVDCDPDTMNICPNAIRNAITSDTVGIITINYGGVSCDYESILEICNQYQLFLIEDNAHGVHSTYKNIPLGNFGHISTFSFDYMKNISCGEGGGMIINDDTVYHRFIQCYYFGTNRQDFIEKKASSYEWKSLGTNAQLAEPLAVILKTQLLHSLEILQHCKKIWDFYDQSLQEIEGKVELARISSEIGHNGQIFWIKTRDLNERTELTQFLNSHKISVAPHYTPLHTSEFGRKVGEFRGEDRYTTKDSLRLLRLPVYYQLQPSEAQQVVDKIIEFYTIK